MNRKLALVLLSVFLLFTVLADAQAPRRVLLRNPAISNHLVVFSYGEDLWAANRDGSEARPLTTGPGIKTDPHISPDGKWIAFSGLYDGNVDVYVMPAAGGVPHRLTFHPGRDEVAGWTPDSKQVLFRSARNSYAQFNRLFTVALDGGLPHEVPLPMAEAGSYSPDGARLAYVPVTNGRPGIAWKRYRGGRAARVWIAHLSDSSVEEVPRDNSNDLNPMWVGQRLYFLSDRNGPVTLFAYDTASRKVEPVLPATGADIKSASTDGEEIIYEQVGSLHVLDLKSGQARELKVNVAGDIPSVRPRFQRVAHDIQAYNLSPSGVRAVFEAHGEIFTVPAEKGDVRDLTNTPGVAERDPAWSPDGKSVAYFSDLTGEYALYIRSQDGMGEARKISLADSPTFYYEPKWSPDSKKILYTDKQLNLWYLDLAKGAPVKVDTDYYEAPFHSLDPSWSPDSRWITYTRQLPSHMCAVLVYSLETGKSFQVTDGLSDARWAVFDKNGKYLYFTASTNIGPTTGWLDLSSFGRAVTRSVYVVVLRKDLPSPLAPESDEEKAADSAKPEGEKTEAAANATSAEEKAAEAKKTDKTEKKEPVVVRMDEENISQRILALPVPARNYTGLLAGASGQLFLLESAPFPEPRGDFGLDSLYRFELTPRKIAKLLDGLSAFAVSFDGKKMLYRQGRDPRTGKWSFASVPPPSKSGEEGSPEVKVKGEPLKLESLAAYVDPRVEWRQMYREVWRIERDFFYDPNLHGLNWKTAEKQYEVYLDGLSSRDDLDYIFQDMLGEISAGHMYIRPPRGPDSDQPRTGLLGADYTIENGRYRFARVYYGENWNPGLRAPLTQPGVNVAAGEYLLAVNGRELRAADNIFSFFQGTAGKQTLLKVGVNPSDKGARSVTVVPIENETALRNRAWIDANRRKVEELSGGRVAYVYLPDTGVGGYTSFNRYYFAQVGKEGAVIDERFNRGGAAADYVIDYLRRPLLNYWMTREGHDFTTPLGSIYGPKAMIINMYAGSGGDALPWYFRASKLGPLVGTRTWGGLVGIYDYPPLLDGGAVTAPRVAFYNPQGQWDVENHGVAPDVEVEISPKAWRDGRDPQLEKAVELVLQQLKEHPLPVGKRPAFPNYHQQGAAAGAAQGK